MMLQAKYVAGTREITTFKDTLLGIFVDSGRKFK